MAKQQGHLEMIQGIVNRLSNNSFLLQGWKVVLILALFALATQSHGKLFSYLAYFPFVAFWRLNGHFLWQEHRFRALYDHARMMKEEDSDYSMNVTAELTDPFYSVAPPCIPEM